MISARRFATCTAAVLIGALVAPISIALSLDSLPVILPAGLYGALAFLLGLISPKRSWQWGLWVTLGIPLAIVLVPIAQLVASAQGLEPPAAFSFGFVWTVLRLGYLPGMLGGGAGGYLGAALGGKWAEG